MLRFLLKRAWHTRLLLLPVLLGVLAAVTVLCSVPLLARAAANTSLQTSLRASGTPLDHNLEVQFTTSPLDEDIYARATSEVTANVQAFLGRDLAQAAPLRSGVDAHLLIYAPDNHRFPKDFLAQYLQPSRSALWFHSGMNATHLTLTAGHFPSPAVTSTPTNLGMAYEVEAMLAPEWATQLNLKLGQELDLLEPKTHSTSFLRIRLVGFFQPKSLDDPAWFGALDPFVPAIHFGDSPDLPPPPFWIDETAFNTALPHLELEQSLVYSWFYQLNLQGVSALTAQTTLENILAIKRFVEQSNPGNPPQPIAYTVLTNLDSLLQAFFQQQFFVTIATLVAILPGLALLLLYLGLAAAALSDHHRDELALMKCRGASAWQILALSALEALLLCAISLLLAPELAGQITRMFVNHSFFGAAVSSAAEELTTPDLQTYLAAATAALLCGGVAVLPVIGAARSSEVALRRQAARFRPAPLWLRLGPGVLLTALGVFGALELSQRGRFFTQNAQGRLSIDWVASATPTLLLLGAAGLSLLLVPPLLVVLDRLAQRSPGVAFSMATRQMARRPSPYSRLVLLLALTLALGVFASLFSGTLVQSAADRAAYESGSDLRLVEGAIGATDLNRVAAPLSDHLAVLPGASDGMNIFRATDTRPTGVLQSGEVTTLAVDSTKFERLAYWRADFADTPLAVLMQTVRQKTSQPDAIPALVDDRLLADTGQHLGDALTLHLGSAQGVGDEAIPISASFVIVGVFHYFPTLDTSQYALVCDITRLLQQVNRIPHASITPNEVWLKLAPTAPLYTTGEQVEQQLQHPTQHLQVIVTVQQVYDRQVLLANLRSDPLHSAISGALSLDFVVAALLSVVGFVVLFTLLVKRRVFEFGVLRALGLSLLQLGRALSWEQVILVGAAVLLGGALGVALANATLPALTTDQTGKALLPPFTLHLDTLSLLQLGLFLLACVLAVLAATAVIFRRLKIQEVLRLGEE
jgi:putative ABC transport system permease protein